MPAQPNAQATQRALNSASVITALSALMLVSACGGAGTSGVSTTPPPVPSPTPTPTPTPTPVPTPTPTPSPSISSSSVAAHVNAQPAYTAGLTGSGVTIAIIDTGIDVNNTAFTGRISSASTSMPAYYSLPGSNTIYTYTYPLQDAIGHGTWVASVAAANSSGAGPQGVAPGATILAIGVTAPANVTYSAATTAAVAANSAPAQSQNAILITADAINYAVNNGAFVINYSGYGLSTDTSLTTAMGNLVAKGGLFVTGVSDKAGQDSFNGAIAQQLVGPNNQYVNNFLFGIMAGVAPASNGNPGSLGSRTIAVPGVENGTGGTQNIYVANAIGGISQTVSGNSFAAPAISGAAALLKQYWPQLNGSQIATILLETADSPTSANSVKEGNISGYAMLDIGNAMTAQTPAVATTTGAAVAAAAATANTGQNCANTQASNCSTTPGTTTGTAVSAALSATGLVFSPAFGSAAGAAKFGTQGGNIVAMDRYGRNFTYTSASIAHSWNGPQGVSLMGLLNIQPTYKVAIAQGQAGLLDFASRFANEDYAHPVINHLPATVVMPLVGGGTLNFTGNGGVEQSPFVTGQMFKNLGFAPTGTSFAIAYPGYSVRAGFSSGNGSSATTFGSTAGLGTQGALFGDPDTTALAANGGLLTPRHSVLSDVSVTLKNGLVMGFASATEQSQALGMTATGAFLISGAQSTFGRIGYTKHLAGWTITGEAMLGQTRVQADGNMLAFASPVITTGARFQADHAFSGGWLSLGLTAPLAPSRAVLAYTRPTSYNWHTNTLTDSTSTINMAPDAREMDVEGSWTKAISRWANLSMGASLTANTENQAGLTTGTAWMKFSSKF